MSRTVLVTGAGSGFGLAASLQLAERGFNVYASIPDASQRPDVAAAAARHGVRLRVVELDVTEPESIRAAVEIVLAEAGGVYAVVHSAGLGLRGFFEDLDDAEIRRLFAVNVFGVMNVTRAVLPAMRAAREGRIVIVTSAGGRIASMTLSGYCAAKFALEGFGESLSMEVAPFGIAVSLVAPGIVMTPHFTVNRGRARRALDPAGANFARFTAHERLVDEVLQAGHITPADVAKAIHRAVSARRPKLRYVVGWRVGLLTALKRRVPGELFARVYASQYERVLRRHLVSAPALSSLTLPDEHTTEYLGLQTARGQGRSRD
jgi:NAD(P)-dependent dehydrogenase (short-subunit alcohol dehydrogenase family)